MNKLAVIIPFYKRPELTKLCFSRLLEQSKYIEVENQPLGRKLNALIKKCKSYDGVILLGSDDFISDSIIEMYQEIDCTKPVYYVFDDVYVYSAKYREVRSGLNYKKRNTGVGIGRMYTKPALEKLNYHVWDDLRVKGLDSNAHTKCVDNGVGIEWVELGNHFMIDAKIEDNITSQEVVMIRDTTHPLSIMNRLGKTGEAILEMKFGNERIYNNKEFNPEKYQSKKIMCRVLKAFNKHNEKDLVMFKKHLLPGLIQGEYIEVVV